MRKWKQFWQGNHKRSASEPPPPPRPAHLPPDSTEDDTTAPEMDDASDYTNTFPPIPHKAPPPQTQTPPHPLPTHARVRVSRRFHHRSPPGSVETHTTEQMDTAFATAQQATATTTTTNQHPTQHHEPNSAPRPPTNSTPHPVTPTSPTTTLPVSNTTSPTPGHTATHPVRNPGTPTTPNHVWDPANIYPHPHPARQGPIPTKATSHTTAPTHTILGQCPCESLTHTQLPQDRLRNIHNRLRTAIRTLTAPGQNQR